MFPNCFCDIHIFSNSQLSKFPGLFSCTHNLALIGFYQDVDKDRVLIVFLCLLAGASKDDRS